MRINKLKLRNWCQIENKKTGEPYVVLDFSGKSMIGVIGDNGSGKSNLLDSIKFLITGETYDNLSEYVRYGTSETKVEVNFSLDTTVVDVTRTIDSAGKSTAVMRVVDEPCGVDETLRGSAVVNEYLQNLLDIDKDLAKNNIFVKQKHLDDILFTTPAKRERAWQRLCGLGDAEKIHNYLGKVLSTIPEVVDYTSQIMDCKDNIAILQDQMTERGGDIESKTKYIKENGSSAAIFGVQEALRACARDRAKLPELEAVCAEDALFMQTKADELAVAKARLQEIAKEADTEVHSVAAVLLDQRDTVDSIFNSLAKAEANQQSIADTAESIAKAKSGLEALRQQDMSEVGAAVDALKADVEAIREKQALATANLSMYQGLVDTVKKSNLESVECPLCGSDIPDKGWLIDRVDGILKKHSDDIATLRSESADTNSLLTQGAAVISSHESDMYGLQVSIDNLESRYATLSTSGELDVLEQYDRDLMAQTRKDIDAKLSEVATINNSITHIDSTIQKATLENARRLTELQEVRTGAEVYPADIDVGAQAIQLDEMHAKAAAIEGELSVMQGANAADEANVKNWQASLESMERMTSTGTTDCRVRNSLERIRNWFHYSEGPHKVTMAVLHELTGGVNEFLSTLDGRFYVVPDPENLMFRVIFTDGRDQPEEPIPATRLSGGEKASLATAFRLASYYMFSGQLGLICLDEPTEYLDARKVEAFGRFVEKLKDISESLGLQVFMATHRKGIVPLFDEVVNM